MRVKTRLTVACIMAALIAPVVYGASEITVDYMSAYVWRGQVLNSAAVVQPGMTVETPVGLSLNTWGNMDATKKNEEAGKFNEIDLTADYAIPMGEESPVALNVGVINYTFPYLKSQAEDGGFDDTTEIYACLCADVIAAPCLTVYYDIDNVNSYYANFSVGYSYDLTEELALDVGASISYAGKEYNEAYFGDGADSAGINDANVSVGLGYALTEDIGVGVSATYTTVQLNSDIKDSVNEEFKDIIYGGLSLAYAF